MKKSINNNSLVIAFIALNVIISAISALAIYTLNFQYSSFDALYRTTLHEKSVALQANTQLIMVHRAMKDAALSESSEDLQKALANVEYSNSQFLSLLDSISRPDINSNREEDRLIKTILKLYNEWTPIRETTISHTMSGNRERAYEITKTLCATQVLKINSQMDLLIELTSKNAEASFQTGERASKMKILFLILLSIIAVFVGILIAINVYRKFSNIQQSLHREKENLKITLESIGDGVITTDINQNVQMLNSVAVSMTGWTREEAIGKPFLDVFNISYEEPGLHITNPIQEVLATDKIYELSNHAVLTSKLGFRRHVSDKAAPIKDVNGKTNGVVMVFRDVTDKTLYMNEIKQLSFHDNLTGIYNRAYFEKELDRLDKSTELPISVIIGDLNGLKLMNDVYGHSVGDALLIKVASIIKECSKGIGVPTRWGGDEFTLLLPKTSHDDALALCERINKECIEKSKDPLILSISFGVSTKTDASQNLRTALIDAEDKMYTHKLVEGKSIRSMIISSLRKTLAERSCETEAHSIRMIQYITSNGKKLNLTQSELDEIKLLILLHDVGKIGIPDDILNKPSALTEEEWATMKKHPEIGYRIALSTYELANIADLILTHHEKWDGSGYPQGIKGEQIPKLSRLLSIIDAYDAMTNDRPYHASVNHERAIDEIKRCSGNHFDPKLARDFIESFDIAN